MNFTIDSKWHQGNFHEIREGDTRWVRISTRKRSIEQEKSPHHDNYQHEGDFGASKSGDHTARNHQVASRRGGAPQIHSAGRKPRFPAPAHPRHRSGYVRRKQPQEGAPWLRCSCVASVIYPLAPLAAPNVVRCARRHGASTWTRRRFRSFLPHTASHAAVCRSSYTPHPLLRSPNSSCSLNLQNIWPGFTERHVKIDPFDHSIGVFGGWEGCTFLQLCYRSEDSRGRFETGVHFD